MSAPTRSLPTRSLPARSFRCRRGSLSHLLPPTLLALLLLALITGVSYQSSLRFTEDTQWVVHTHQVLEDIAVTQSALERAESSQRGYLLAGDVRDLRVYEAAKQEAVSGLSALVHLTADNPTQQKRLADLTPLVNARLDNLQAALGRRRRGGAGTVLMEDIRRRLAALQAEESRLLTLRVNAAEDAGALARTLIVSGVGLVVLLMGLGAAMAGQYRSERNRTEAALRTAQENLERKVRDRTAEIEQAGAALQQAHAALEDRVQARTAELVSVNRTLEESEAQFRSVIGAMQEGLLVCDQAGTILLCNQAAERIFGVPASHLIGQNGLAERWQATREDGTVLLPGDYPLAQALGTGQAQAALTLCVAGLPEDCLWLTVSAAPLFRAGEEIPYAAVATFTDITDRARSEAALRRAEENYRSIYENSIAGIFHSTPAGKLLKANSAAARLLGYETSEALIAGTFDVGTQFYYQPEDRARVVAQLLETGSVVEFETPFRRRDGGVVWVSMNARVQRDGSGTIEYLEGSIYDITERRAAEQRMIDYNVVLEFQKKELEKTNTEMERVNAQLEELATLDGLTGLKNRRAFGERLAEEFGRAQRYSLPLALVMLDVDCFKGYNDAFGHLAGDQVLIRVAAVLRESIRESDYAARYGGEEFVLILPQTDLAGAEVIAERCRRAIEEAAWEQRPVTASFGVSAASLTMQDGAELIARADTLLYAAKAAGRNRIEIGQQNAPPLSLRKRRGRSILKTALESAP